MSEQSRPSPNPYVQGPTPPRDSLLEPRMISGLSGPENRFESEEDQQIIRQPGEEITIGPVNLSRLDEDIVVFQSRHASHRLTLTRPTKVEGTEPPEWKPGLRLQFEGGLALVNTDPEVNPEGKKTVVLAKKHKAFNIDFWDAREAQANADKVAREQARDILKNEIARNPQEVLDIIKELQKEGGVEFKLPSRAAEKTEGSPKEPPKEPPEGSPKEPSKSKK